MPTISWMSQSSPADWMSALFFGVLVACANSSIWRLRLRCTGRMKEFDAELHYSHSKHDHKRKHDSPNEDFNGC